MKFWQLRLLTVLLPLLAVARVDAYHLFQAAPGVPARWQTTGLVFIADADGPGGQDFTVYSAQAQAVWNNVADALDVFGAPTASATNFTGANHLSAWGNLTGDGQYELVYDADGSALSAVGLDPAVYNGVAPSRRRLDGGVGIIDDAFFVVNGSRTNFDVLSTLIHELGHILGIAHSSVGMHNSATAESALDKVAQNSVPTMHPFSLATGNTSLRTLEADDEAALRELYPATGAASRWATISGEVRRCGTDAVVTGANVRIVNTANSSIQISRFTSFDGNGSGRYTMNFVPAGSYRVVVEPMGASDFHPGRFPQPPARMEMDFDYEYLSPAAVELPCSEDIPEVGAANIATVAATNGATSSGNDFRVGFPSLAFVVDDTGSMSQEIAAVRTILNGTITALEAASVVIPFPTTAFVTFKDDVTKRIVSNNPAQLRTIVNSLTAGGGGDCPEAGNAALLVGGRMLKQNGVALLFTDADSRPDGPARSAVESAYRAKGVRLFTLMSGTCSGSITADAAAPRTTPLDGGLDAEPAMSFAATATRTTASANAEQFLPPPVNGFEPGITTFSNISNSTGGLLVAITGINSGSAAETTRYTNTGTNLAISAVLPALALASPTNTPAGTTLNVEINGSNTNFINGRSTFRVAGGGVTVNSIVVNSPSQLLANITLDAGAALGFRDAFVTTDLGGGLSEEARGIGLVNVTSTPVAATTLSVTPSLGRQGQTVDVTINAAAITFTSGSVASFGFGTTVLSSELLNPTTLRARVQVDTGATVGYRRVMVTTPGVGIAVDSSPAGLFQVAAPGPVTPTIASVTPNQVARNSVTTVVVNGLNTNFSSATELSFSGTGIVVNSIQATSPTSLQANLTVAADASLGFRDVFASTGGIPAAGLGALQVVAAVQNPADVNNDGTVNCADLQVIRAAFGTTSTQPRFDARADVNRDNRVDARDLTFVAQRLPAGVTCN